MPTYDYECKNCGYEFEYFQAMSEDPLDTCPECGGELRRLIGGGTGVIFKASGFYVTDNKKQTQKADGASGGNGSGDGSGNGTGEKKEKQESASSSGSGSSAEGGSTKSSTSAGTGKD